MSNEEVLIVGVFIFGLFAVGAYIFFRIKFEGEF